MAGEQRACPPPRPTSGEPGECEQHTQGVEFCKKGEGLEIDEGKDEDNEVDGHVVTAPVVMKVAQPDHVNWKLQDRVVSQKASTRRKTDIRGVASLAYALELGATVVVLSGNELNVGIDMEGEWQVVDFRLFGGRSQHVSPSHVRR